MRMIVDPILAFSREGRFFSRTPFGSVLADQYQLFFKNILGHIVENSCSTVVGKLPRHPIALCHRLAPAIKYVAQIA